MVKSIIKNVVAGNCSNFNYPILINSYGRSGSTVLTNSIVKSAIKSNNTKIRDIAYRSISQYAWDLESASLKNGIVYKTHDYPTAEKFENKVRILYTFADPVDVVCSLLRLFDERGEEWMKEHYNHLKVPYNNFENIINKDQLQLEQHLDNWLQESRFPIAFVKYETMWDHEDDISDFLGFKVNLIPFRERKSKGNGSHEQMSKIEETYATLRKKVGRLNNYFTSPF